MVKIRFALIYLSLFVFGYSNEQIQIIADSFFADENKQISEFNGNVKIKKGSFDELSTKNLVVYFDKNHQPIKYVATGDVKFKIIIKQKHYDGNADLLTYESVKEIYTLTNQAHLHEIDTNKHIYGDKIVINNSSGTYNVNSNEKNPVKFIFQIEKKK